MRYNGLLKNHRIEKMLPEKMEDLETAILYIEVSKKYINISVGALRCALIMQLNDFEKLLSKRQFHEIQNKYPIYRNGLIELIE